MSRFAKSCLAALALACLPGCAALKATPLAIENPLAAAQNQEQRAYALIQTYAATLEEATDLIKRDDVPFSVKRAIGEAEAIATPSMDVLRLALAAYLRARADYALAKDKPQIERAAALLAISAVRLRDAEMAARASIQDLKTQFAAARQRKA